MSSWSKKLETKISPLTNTSSSESVQALATWISFNRKRANDFVPVLSTYLKSNPTLTLNILNEVLLQERGTEKWDKFSDLRIALGESVLLPNAAVLSPLKATVLQMCKEWDAENVFGGPTLLRQIKKAVSEATVVPDEEEKTKATESLADTKAPEPSLPDIKEVVEEDTLPDVSSDLPLVQEAVTAQVPTDSFSYDFEAAGIPEEEVSPKALLQPAQSLASMQIMRDIRAESATKLSALFAALPDDIKETAKKVLEVEKFDIDEATARDFAERTAKDLIDTDVEDQLQSIRVFRNVVSEQIKARKLLINLLIKSRCKFGADEAASTFETSDRASGELRKRKQVLIDTMDLEGVTPEDSKVSETTELSSLPPLDWYKPKKAKSGE